MRKKILWITETAVMLALLVAVQGLTSGLGNQFITGSCVNLMAAISPFVAFLFGIGPKFIQLIPVIAVGNLVLVLVLSLLKSKQVWHSVVAWIVAAVAKFGTLYILMVKLVVPALVAGGTIPAKAAATIAVQFGWPQLVTALIGGGLALVIVPAVRKALKR